MFPSYFLSNPDFAVHYKSFWYVLNDVAAEVDCYDENDAYYEIYSDY
jgi:hypothetical protein